jgi:hypothetical protein
MEKTAVDLNISTADVQNWSNAVDNSGISCCTIVDTGATHGCSLKNLEKVSGAEQNAPTDTDAGTETGGFVYKKLSTFSGLVDYMNPFALDSGIVVLPSPALQVDKDMEEGFENFAHPCISNSRL